MTLIKPKLQKVERVKQIRCCSVILLTIACTFKMYSKKESMN
jgi:hypothetical protein